jgi:hypothetical protein
MASTLRKGLSGPFRSSRSYTLTHSWSRELKRRRRTTLAATTFLVPDDEIVLTRHYREDHCAITAAEAVGFIRSRPDPRGYEIMSTQRYRAGSCAAEGYRLALLFGGEGQAAVEEPGGQLS